MWSISRKKQNLQRGFTIVELAIAITVGSLLIVVVYSFFANSYTKYMRLQEDALKFSNLAVQSQRVAKVLRGSTDVLEATSTAVTVYAYFTPRDAIVSKIRYYYDSASTSLKADVTPMSSAPPIGTPVTAQKVTYTVVGNFYVAGGTNVFEYLNSVGGTIGAVTNLRDVKGMRINMAVPATKFTTTKNTTITAEVALRNRKTNL